MSLRTLFQIRRPGTVALACVLALSQLGVAVLPLSAQAAAAAKGAAKKAPEATVTLNFVNADIEGVSRAIAAILDRQIMVDPRVKGTITLYSEQPLTPREAYLNFLAALRGQGFTLVEVAGLLKVVPEAEAKLQTGGVSVGNVTQRGDQVLTQIFRLQYENPNNLVTVLRPLISPNNTINANPSNNTLVITDYADNLQRIAKIIAAMDVPSTTDLDIIPLKHAIASDVAALLQRMGDAPGGTATGGTSAATAAGSSGMTVLADPRTNSLLVRAPNPAKLANIRSLVDKLDRPGMGGIAGSGIYVVYLKNADATKLAQVLRASFSPDARNNSGSSATSGGGSAATYAGGGVGNAAQTGMNASSTSSSGSSTASVQSTAPVQGSASPVTGGYIQADPATNSLIITATEPQYRQLRAVIDQLDSRRAQVYVETMIVKISADKVDQIGVQWQGILGGDGAKNALALGTNFGSTGNLVTVTTNQFSGAAKSIALNAGLNMGLIHSFGGTYALGALANFLGTTDDANILSTPNVVALDNEEAKIVVGQNVPFVTGQYTNNNSSSGSVNPFQTVERKDVGLTLRIKPQIGEDGTIRMTIYQENSDLVGSTLTNSTGPVTDKSSIETSVVVNDSQVIVLGGLIRDELTNNQSKVPGLGDLPLVGGLFRSEAREHKKQNLMVFLRPVVLRNQDAANSVTADRYDLIRSNQLRAQPESRWLGKDTEVPVFLPRPDDNTKLPLGGSAAPLSLPFTPAPKPAEAPAAPVAPAPAASAPR
ncbi:type II secretion system secretin GspD [Aquabacterium sp.]|uniref:type II secretion system secretin GspD n=1 Tax=Aquabacterium sp. TaxID=1872578 RepID=UPI0035B041B0